MVEYEIKSTVAEADLIAKGIKDFVFRNAGSPIGEGDLIRFRVMKDKKDTAHKISKMKFRVVYVDAEQPIENGFKVIGFRRTAV